MKKSFFFTDRKQKIKTNSFIDIITKNLYNNMKLGDKYVKIYKS